MALHGWIFRLLPGRRPRRRRPTARHRGGEPFETRTLLAAVFVTAPLNLPGTTFSDSGPAEFDGTAFDVAAFGGSTSGHSASGSRTCHDTTVHRPDHHELPRWTWNDSISLPSAASDAFLLPDLNRIPALSDPFLPDLILSELIELFSQVLAGSLEDAAGSVEHSADPATGETSPVTRHEPNTQRPDDVLRADVLEIAHDRAFSPGWQTTGRSGQQTNGTAIRVPLAVRTDPLAKPVDTLLDPIITFIEHEFENSCQNATVTRQPVPEDPPGASDSPGAGDAPIANLSPDSEPRSGSLTSGPRHQALLRALFARPAATVQPEELLIPRSSSAAPGVSNVILNRRPLDATLGIANPQPGENPAVSRPESGSRTARSSQLAGPPGTSVPGQQVPPDQPTQENLSEKTDQRRQSVIQSLFETAPTNGRKDVRPAAATAPADANTRHSPVPDLFDPETSDPDTSPVPAAEPRPLFPEPGAPATEAGQPDMPGTAPLLPDLETLSDQETVLPEIQTDPSSLAPRRSSFLTAATATLSSLLGTAFRFRSPRRSGRTLPASQRQTDHRSSAWSTRVEALA